MVEQPSGEAVAEVDNGRRQRERDDGDELFKNDEADREKECEILVEV